MRQLSPSGTRRWLSGAATIGAVLVAATMVAPAAGALVSPAPTPALWAAHDGRPEHSATGTTERVSADGATVFVTGSTFSEAHGLDFRTIAYDAVSGAPRWAVSTDDAAHQADTPNDLALSPDGSLVFVTGQTEVAFPSDYDILTVALDATTGHEVWRKTYGGPAGSFDSGASVVTSTDGARLFVSGTTGDAAVTLAYDASNGQQQWATTYDGPKHLADEPVQIVAGPGGARVYVVMFADTDNSARGRFTTVAYNASNGTQKWVARYDGPAQERDQPAGAVVSPDGSMVYVTGSAFTDTGVQAVTIAYRGDTGRRQWLSTYADSQSSDNRALAIAISPDGSRVAVTGDGSTAMGGMTVAYDAANGAQQWVAHHRKVGGGRSVAFAANGARVYVVSDKDTVANGSDIATTAFDATAGTSVWNAQFDGSGHSDDFAAAVRADPDGSKVFVAGTVGTTHGSAIVTIAYAA